MCNSITPNKRKIKRSGRGDTVIMNCFLEPFPPVDLRAVRFIRDTYIFTENRFYIKNPHYSMVQENQIAS